MARSKNPQDFPFSFHDTLMALYHDRSSPLIFKLPSKLQADNLRREFYSYKRALDTAITTYKPGHSIYSDSDIELYRQHRRMFGLFQLSTRGEPDGTGTLTFLPREQSTVGQLAANALAEALSIREAARAELNSDTPSTTSPTLDIEDLPPEQQDDILKRWEEGRRKLAMIESGELPDPLAHIPKKS